MKRTKVFVILGVGFTSFLAIYFVILYMQVKASFQSTIEHIPTRIYSNLIHITAPQSRGTITRHLYALGYKPVFSGNSIRFVLHSLTYPIVLLPEGHPTRSLMDQEIILEFEDKKDSSELVSIQSEGKNYEDIYLEPELVATLSGNDTSNKIMEPLKLSEIPPMIPAAIIAAEDQHFYSHFGIDPRGFIRAQWNNLKSLSLTQGGSTITQQLVKNLSQRRNRNLFLKINELFLAPMLELQFSKDEILTRYLNEVFLGQIGNLEVRGISEGARYFFGKTVNELNLGEVALMVGIIKGPGYFWPYKHFDRAQGRQRYVLERMLDTGKITQFAYSRALKDPIRLSPPPTASNRAPYFVDFARAEVMKSLSGRFTPEEIESVGFRIYTTLDVAANEIAQDAVQKGIDAIEKRLGITGIIRLQGALATADPSTGEIRALVGGRSYKESNFNRILNMKRQVGSTFKPVVYLTALRANSDGSGGQFTPAYPLEDKKWKWKYDKSQPEYSPANYEKESAGWIPLRKSLSHSINTTTMQLAKMVGMENIIDTARDLGVSEKLLPVPSLALGSVEMSPIEVLNMYLTLANRGERDEPTVIKAIVDPDGQVLAHQEYHPKQRIDPGVADLMTDLLQTVFTDGTAESARAWGFDRPAAGKTGTTNDYRDAWFSGYTPQLVTVVWVGLDQGTIAAEFTAAKEAAEKAAEKVDPKLAKEKKKKLPKIHLTGAVAALPIWADFMKRALANSPALPFPPSEFLVEARLDSKTGQLVEGGCLEAQIVTEKVIAGREPRNKTCARDFTNGFKE